MLDIGGPELLLIAVIGIMVIGPKELPNAIRTVTLWVRKARGLAREFQGGLDEMVREAELDKMQDEIKGGLDDFSIENRIQDSIDPDGEIRDSFDGDWYSDHDEFDADGDDGTETEDVAGVLPDTEPDETDDAVKPGETGKKE